MRRRRFLAVLGCASLPIVPACDDARPPPKAPPAAPSRPLLFDVHDNVWMNLHRVLYGKGLERGKDDKGGGGGNGLEVLAGIDPSRLPDVERATWLAAVEHYTTSIVTRDPIFDDGMADIENRISARDGAADLRGAGLPEDLAGVIERAIPIYRARWWPEHDRANRAWIASLEPWVERHGDALARELAGLYRTEWPKEPFRVDVTRYANWAGAYTTRGPDRLTIAGGDPRNALPTGAEILFHEASHAIINPVRDALRRELDAQGKKADDLWHAVLFFTTGEAVKRRVPGYVPFAFKYGLYERSWKAFLPAIEAHWRPYVEGRTTFETALHDLVAAL